MTAGADASPEDLAKVLDVVKTKAAASPPPVTDCDCKAAQDAAKAKGEKALATAKAEADATVQGINAATAAIEADLAKASAKLEELNKASEA